MSLSDPIDDVLDAVESGESIFANREILKTSYIPDTILHRDKEQKEITYTLSTILKGSKPSNLLVFGKTGTGKTLVVKKIISKIQAKVEKSNFTIKLLYSNSKDETTIYGLLTSLGRQLNLTSKELPTTGLAIGEVFKRILHKIDSNSLNIVMVIDEIDYLAGMISKTKNDILYQLTRANDEHLKNGSLTLIGISNDLRFKDLLNARVVSSLSAEEVVFTNYNVDQIKKILKTRIDESFVKGTVEEPALNLCAAKAGGEHGDARRAIDLIRIAGEIAERQKSQTVTETHVREAHKKIEESKEEIALTSYPLHQKLVIISLMKSKDPNTGSVYSAYKALCKATGQEALTSRRITQILSEIELSGLISGRLIHQGTHGSTKKWKLTITSETIKKTFKDDLALHDVL